LPIEQAGIPAGHALPHVPQLLLSLVVFKQLLVVGQ
jgi:hypothetical protein